MTNMDYTSFSSPTTKHYSSRCCDSFEHGYEFSSFPTDSVVQSSVNIPIDPSTTRSSRQKTISRTNKMPGFQGPEVFGKVLGPTADESILVGLQAIMDMAGSLEFAGSFASLKAEPSSSSSTEQQSPLTTHTRTNLCNSMLSPIASSPTASPSSTSLAPITSTSPGICTSHEDYRTEILNEIKRVHCPIKNCGPIIITEDNISAAMHASKRCQQSQTRVLPHSMVCYEQESATSGLSMPYKTSAILQPLSCLRSIPSEREVNFPTPRRPTPPKSRVTKGTQRTPSPCSKYFQRTTTISVIEPTMTTPTTPNYTCDACTCDPCEPCTNSRPPSRTRFVEQIAQIKPNVCDAYLETDNRTYNCSAVGCSCEMSMPNIQNSDCFQEVGVNKDVCCNECACGTYHSCRNKSCACYLIPQSVTKADAAISALKVNTSCQYHRAECFPSETRSTQCEKRYPRSSTNLHSDSGEYYYPTYRKRSVRIIGDGYDCKGNLSRCAITTKRSSKLFVSPYDCEEIYKNRPGQEMGDIAISSPTEVRYAITKITKFKDFSTFEVMKSTSKKPKCIPKAVEGVFVLKKDETSPVY